MPQEQKRPVLGMDIRTPVTNNILEVEPTGQRSPLTRPPNWPKRHWPL